MIEKPKKYSVDDLHFDGYGDTEVVFADHHDKYVAELEKDWISIEDELPEIEVTVLVYDALFTKYDDHTNKKDYGGYTEPGVRFGRREQSGWFRTQGVNGNCQITHWMPLPKPPK